MSKRPKLLIIGHGRHGKDTMAELLEDKYGMTFRSSSIAASEIFIYEKIKEKYDYVDAADCFHDRCNHRAEWYNMICEYNKHDRAKLAKDILKDSDCYVGMRDLSEIDECMKQRVFDLIVWVDASERLPKECSNSFNVPKNRADVVIYNNGTFAEFTDKVHAFGKLIFN
jgi:dephospho-CoA kinase